MNEPAEMLPCKEVMAQLWLYLDGELTPKRKARIREHLDVCSRCYPQYDFQKAFLEFLQTKCTQEAPTEVRRRVFQRLLDEDA